MLDTYRVKIRCHHLECLTSSVEITETSGACERHKADRHNTVSHTVSEYFDALVYRLRKGVYDVTEDSNNDAAIANYDPVPSGSAKEKSETNK